MIQTLLRCTSRHSYTLSSHNIVVIVIIITTTATSSRRRGGSFTANAQTFTCSATITDTMSCIYTFRKLWLISFEW